jgi:hypothetical protein
MFGPDAGFDVLTHDGRVETIDAVLRRLGQHAATLDGPPPVLIIDDTGRLWGLIKDEGSARARDAHRAREILAGDPNADIPMTHTHWGPANAAWDRIVAKLVTFPGIVILSARGGEETINDDTGNPRREYRTAVHPGLKHAVTCWIQVPRGRGPRLAAGKHPTVDMSDDRLVERRLGDNWSLAGVVFDILQYTPGPTRPVNQLVPTADPPATEKYLWWKAQLEAVDMDLPWKAVDDDLRTKYKLIQADGSNRTIHPTETSRLSRTIRTMVDDNNTRKPAEVTTPAEA